MKYEHISREIAEITKWVISMPNDERTWSRVRETVSGYLDQLWRNGDLVGATTSEAYFVRCDSDTNTACDRKIGRLTILVGIATKKPTEFEMIQVNYILKM
jgi:phage tail sheath protein FI